MQFLAVQGTGAVCLVLETCPGECFCHLPGDGYVDPNAFVPRLYTTWRPPLPSPGISPHLERSAGRDEVKAPAKVACVIPG